jgi:KipI family sensor histidine kinase inhibitor
MLREQPEQPRISLMGTAAVLFEAPGPFDLPHQRRIWALAEYASGLPDVREAVPGMTNLTLLFARPPRNIAAIAQSLTEVWHSGIEVDAEGRTMELPIVYGGETGPHLREVSHATGLSIDDVVAIHTAPVYTVFAVGSHAGYCYLGGLDPRLFLPRRAVPLLSIPGGSLSIAGSQTGVSASAGPSGWHTIGFTDTRFFDLGRDPATLLQPGDRIHFHAQTVIR